MSVDVTAIEFQTIDHWDESLWQKVEKVYYEAFPEQGRKTKEIIRKILTRRLGVLHVAIWQSEVIGMALTGELKQANALLVDYLAVLQDLRNQGVGQRFLGYLKEWATSTRQLVGIIIEIEADTTPANFNRMQFWKHCGFVLTPYIHTYIWVPEPYQAMYLNIHPNATIPSNGEALFRHIHQFHRKAYKK
ncbi:Acetyltransferase (GNAT) family protein [compost metagenome]